MSSFTFKASVEPPVPPSKTLISYLLQYHDLISMYVPLQISMTSCPLCSFCYSNFSEKWAANVLSPWWPLGSQLSLASDLSKSASELYCCAPVPCLLQTSSSNYAVLGKQYYILYHFPSFSILQPWLFISERSSGKIYSLYQILFSLLIVDRCFRKCVCSFLPGSSGNSCGLYSRSCFRKSLMMSSFLILHLLTPIATLSSHSGTFGNLNLLYSKELWTFDLA